MRRRPLGHFLCGAVLLASIALLAPAARALELNGFALEPADVEVVEILEGGPPRDGIPALDAPKTLAAKDAPWEDDERVIAIEVGGEARAYPLAILVWHELVNDTVGGQPILVTYCPLCGTGMVFDRRIGGAGGKARRFGVSGLLYRSDMLLYDRETESLWSQIAAKAITGPARGTPLAPVRSRITTWGSWKAEHPEGRVLSPDTGHRRRYGETPYGEYAFEEKLRFPAPLDRRYHPKMPTAGLRVAGGEARAYPASELLAAGGSVTERFAGHEVSVAYDSEEGLFTVEAPAGVEVIEGYWFAWAAFHPQTEVYRPQAAER